MNMKKNTSAKTDKAVERDPRHLRFRTLSTALTIVVIVGIILLNVIVSAVADRYPITLDMSSDKMFTLSEDGKKFAKSIENEVEVVILADPQSYFLGLAEQWYAYSQINFSNQFERIGREVETALTQLKKHSNGKITYTFINPDQEPEKYAAYADYNMDTDNILFISGERHKKDTLESMVEPIDMNTVYSHVEKVLLSHILALQGEKDRVIQILTGHNEDEKTIAGIKRLYRLNGYTVEELMISGATQFNDDAEVLVIPAPANDYSKEEIRRIDTWLYNENKRNRHLMVFLNPTADCPMLYEMLKESYHIEVTDQLIYETDSDRYRNDGTTFNTSWVWADVASNKYTDKAAGEGVVLMPQARRLLCDLPSAPVDNQVAQWGLVLTTHPDSARVGKIGSDQDKKELKADEYPLISGVSYVFEYADNNTQLAATTTVTVCGSAAMAYEEFTRDYSTNNEELLLNLINSVTGYQSDFSISNKVIAKDVTQFKAKTQMVLGIWVFTVGLPAAVLVICLVVFLRRRSL